MRLRLCFMMHSVLEQRSWDYSHLVSTQRELQTLIDFYHARGYAFVKVRDFYSRLGPSICLTFDDGYLDNWTLLHLYLAKQNIPYTVFINREFVEPSDNVRRWGDTTPGYLSRGELRRMHDSGLADIQSHSASHTWHATSDRVIDLLDVRHKAFYPWMLWNRYPEQKPYWLAADYGQLAGLPVFENDRSLRARRFVFDPDKLRHFERALREKSLNVQRANELLHQEYGTLGRQETPVEQEDRYRQELQSNGQFIQDLLGYWPTVLCWPGGAFNDLSERVAFELHPCATIKRGYGTDSRYIHRLSPTNPYGRDRFPWKHQTLTLRLYTIRYAINAWKETVRNALRVCTASQRD